MLYRIQSRPITYEPPPGATLADRTIMALVVDSNADGDAICSALLLVAPVRTGDAAGDDFVSVAAFLHDDAAPGGISVLADEHCNVRQNDAGQTLELALSEQMARRRRRPLRVAFHLMHGDRDNWCGSFDGTIEPADRPSGDVRK